MSCNNKKLMQLTLLSLFLIFLTTCKKEEIPIENPPIKEPPIEDISTPSETILSNAFVVLKSEKILRNLVLQSIFQLYFYPQLSGLQNDQATTRTGCPSSSINSSNTVVTLNYDNCNTTSNFNYSGIITLTINGMLGVTGTTIDVVLSQDFLINNQEIINGTMEVTYDGIANMKYDITQLAISNNATIPPTDISLSSGQISHFELIDIDGNDDNSNPLTFLENEIILSPFLTVHCPNPDGTQTTLDVMPIGSEVKYSLLCGAPYDGELLLTTTSGETHSSIDFAHPNFSSAPECDDEISICIPDEFGGFDCEGHTL